MPKPFKKIRISTKSELLYGALLLLLALIARSAALSLPASFLRDAASMLSVVMLIGGVIVVVVGLWHAANRAASPGSMPASSIAGWFPDPKDSTQLRFWDGREWTGETARREIAEIRPS